MFRTYLRRELWNRRRQTVIVAAGLALAIATVMVVSAFSAGVRDAQAQVLESLYGVGTDVTVTTPQVPGAGRPRGFDFGSDEGTPGEDGTQQLSQQRLTLERGTAAMDASALVAVQALDGVSAAAATLSLSNVSFSGQIPQPGLRQPGQGIEPGAGSSFDVSSFAVTGVDPAAVPVGPLASAELADGRVFGAGDAAADVAVLDSTYAQSEGIAVGDTVTVGGRDLQVIGTVVSTSASATTASDVYIPLAIAQALSGLPDQVSTIYVQAGSSSVVDSVKADIESTLPGTTVSTQSDLASSVSGSLGTAADLVSSLGRWLAVVVLVAAFLLAILFTLSGVSRRTREFGTLKAIGWRDRRIVGQVAGESLTQGLIGGAVGLVAGLAAILAVNLAGITLSGSAGAPGLAADAARIPGGGPFGGGGPLALVAATTDTVLEATISPATIAVGVAIAVIGGLLAGLFGGWRAARLRPAEALRSVA